MTGVSLHIKLLKPLCINACRLQLLVTCYFSLFYYFTFFILLPFKVYLHTYTWSLCTICPQSLPLYRTEGMPSLHLNHFCLHFCHLISYLSITCFRVCSWIYIRFVLKYELLMPYLTEVVSYIKVSWTWKWSLTG